MSAEGYTFPFKEINGETTGKSNRLLIDGELELLVSQLIVFVR